MLYKIIFRTGLCLVLLVFASCSVSESAASKEASEAGQSETGKVQGQQAGVEGSEVIISLGDKKLTMEQAQWMRPGLDDKKLAEFADWWLENELLYEEAKRRGVTELPKAKFVSEVMRRRAFAQVFRSEVQKAVEVSDAEALAHYEERKDSDLRLKEPGSLTFSHIRTEGQGQAQIAIKRIKSGEDISEVAKQLSTYSDAQTGGKVEGQPYGTVRRFFGTAFFEALLAAKEGDLIGPIRIRGDTYEVGRFEGRIEPEPLPFEQVKEQIKSKLLRNAADRANNELLDSLKKGAADKIVRSPRITKPEKPSPPAGSVKPD